MADWGCFGTGASINGSSPSNFTRASDGTVRCLLSAAALKGSGWLTPLAGVGASGLAAKGSTSEL